LEANREQYQANKNLPKGIKKRIKVLGVRVHERFVLAPPILGAGGWFWPPRAQIGRWPAGYRPPTLIHLSDPSPRDYAHSVHILG
jgi:hypothetical protein